VPAQKVPTHEVPAHKVSAHKVSAHEVHAHEVPAHEVPAYEVPAHKVVDLSRSELQNTSFCVSCGADRRDLENGIQGVKAAIHVFEPHTVDEGFAFLTHNGGESWGLKTRCGRTYEQAFYSDRRLYFLKQMYQRRRRVSPKNNITSFAVARDIFHAFFGVGVQEDETSGLVEDATIANSHSVSPSEASQSEAQLDDTR
jgi:hypothetical protein